MTLALALGIVWGTVSGLPSAAQRAATSEGPGVVVMQWTPRSLGLVEALARTLDRAGIGTGAGLARITCVGEEVDAAPAQSGAQSGAKLEAVEVQTLKLAPELGFDALVELLRDELRIADARAVIVLPRRDVSEPDSISRLTCAAIRRACGQRRGPNILVEIEDPEAAFEFVGLGVATVFYSGHLRAALLGQACVDLGVFQFIIGLLRGRHRVRTIPVPEQLRAKTFADAALELELDERGRPMTIIGVATAPPDAGQAPPGERDNVIVNPGPAAPLREVLGLLALVSGEDEGEDEGEMEPAL